MYLEQISRLNQILTVEDSFLLSKVLTKLKAEIDVLPNVKTVEKIKYNDILQDMLHHMSLLENDGSKDQKLKIISQKSNEKIKNREDGSMNDIRVIIFRREFLLECLEYLKIIIKNNWAKSPIEIIWEYTQFLRHKFIPGRQQKRLEDLWVFLRKIYLFRMLEIQKKHKKANTWHTKKNLLIVTNKSSVRIMKCQSLEE